MNIVMHLSRYFRVFSTSRSLKLDYTMKTVTLSRNVCHARYGDPAKENFGNFFFPSATSLQMKKKSFENFPSLVRRTVVSHLSGVTLKWSPPSQNAGKLLFTLSLSHLSGHFSASGQKYAGVTLKWSDHLSVTLLYSVRTNDWWFGSHMKNAS